MRINVKLWKALTKGEQLAVLATAAEENAKRWKRKSAALAGS